MESQLKSGFATHSAAYFKRFTPEYNSDNWFQLHAKLPYRIACLEENGKSLTTTHPLGNHVSDIKFYNFENFKRSSLPVNNRLIFSEGDLFQLIMTNPSLKTICISIFKEYGYDLVIKPHLKQIEIQRNEQGVIYSLPFSLTADTLQRYIFHLAAILSNRDSILLFEEPEAHCFPPYIAQIANHVIESVTNQFFITTHSPYLLQTIIENVAYEDCAILIASYKEYQTHLRELSQEEWRQMIEFGTDVFINYDAFVR
ncbi:MAG: ATP-binding protein [Sphingobacteriales bacterium]|nr:MAG: ATP-binding protein [Sphingobacteriales bacterium]